MAEVLKSDDLILSTVKRQKIEIQKYICRAILLPNIFIMRVCNCMVVIKLRNKISKYQPQNKKRIQSGQILVYTGKLLVQKLCFDSFTDLSHTIIYGCFHYEHCPALIKPV